MLRYSVNDSLFWSANLLKRVRQRLRVSSTKEKKKVAQVRKDPDRLGLLT